MALFCKNKEEEGSARASPVAAPMPKSVFSERKEGLLGYVYAYMSASLSPLGWPCIYSRCPTSWIMSRIFLIGRDFLLIVSIRFSNGLVRRVYLE